MAEENKITVKLSADTTDFNKAVDEAIEKLKVLIELKEKANL